MANQTKPQGEFVDGGTFSFRKVWLVECAEILDVNGQEVVVHMPKAVYSDEARARERAKNEMLAEHRGRMEAVVSWLWFEDSGADKRAKPQ